MAKLTLKKASTSQSLYLFIQDSSVTTGAGLTGLLFNTASLTAYFVRPANASVLITLVTQTVAGAWSSGGFVEVDATNMPGVYRFDVPDTPLATGKDSVVVMLQGAANMVPVVLEIQLTDVDLNDGVRAGLTALPNAEANAAGGLPISAAGALSMDGIKSDTAAILVDTADMQPKLGTPAGASISADIATVDANVDAILVDTAEIGTAGAGLTDLGGMSTGMKAEVNAEVVDTLATDTYAEPSAAPAFPLTLKDQLGWIAAKEIHKVTQDGSNQKQYKADGTTVIGTEAVSDDGTTTTKGAVA